MDEQRPGPVYPLRHTASRQTIYTQEAEGFEPILGAFYCNSCRDVVHEDDAEWPEARS